MSDRWTISLFFLLQWLAWWFWINTIGRLPGGLAWGPTGLFDLISLFFWLWFWLFSGQGSVRKLSGRKALTEFFAEKGWGQSAWFLLPAGVAVVSAVFYSILLEPIDWDGLDYHLPAILQAVQFKQWGRLDDPYYAVQAFPKLVESLYLFWILHFGPHLYLLLGLVPLLLGAIGLDELAQHFKVSRRWVLLLWLTIPIVIKQVSSLYIDHFVAAFGILACVGLIKRQEKAFALPLAFFVGSKFSAGVPAVVLVLSWMVRYRSIPFWVGAFCGVSLGGTVVPNWIFFGNPLYPFSVSPFGFKLFPGLFNPQKFVDGVPWAAEPFYQRFYKAFFQGEQPARWDMLKGAFGGVQGLALVGALLLKAFYSLRRLSLKAFYLPEVALGFLLSGGNWVIRYHLWVGAVFILWGAELLEALPRRIQQLLWIVLLGQALWLWVDLSWLLGNGQAVRTALATQSYGQILKIVQTRWQELRVYGEPQVAVHPVDQERIRLRKTQGQTYTLCPERRPQQFAAYYGRDFTNHVYFDPAVCSQVED